MSASQLKGLVRLAGVRVHGAQARLARAEAELRNAEQALADEERKLREYLDRAQERRRSMIAGIMEGPQSPARLARLPLVDAVIQHQISTAGGEVVAATEVAERARRTVQQCQSEVALQLQKQRKIEIAYDQLAILDLKGAEIAEEMTD